MIDVVRIETPALGDRSYLAHDGEVGLVVDPQRDIDRITALAASLGVRITHVAETHMHNDYVSGGLALGRLRPHAGQRWRPHRRQRRVPVAGGRYSRPYLQPPRLRARSRG
jgi:glyoxylase-like metal-dependent hydrolase (beta-lactamase superfamily II)